jgi:hypothetical protein
MENPRGDSLRCTGLRSQTVKTILVIRNSSPSDGLEGAGVLRGTEQLEIGERAGGLDGQTPEGTVGQVLAKRIHVHTPPGHQARVRIQLSHEEAESFEFVQSSGRRCSLDGVSIFIHFRGSIRILMLQGRVAGEEATDLGRF